VFRLFRDRDGSGDRDAELAKAADVVLNHFLFLTLGQARGVALLERLSGLKHMMNQQQQGMRDRDQRRFLSALGFTGQTPELVF
jgi:hypothetical protein